MNRVRQQLHGIAKDIRNTSLSIEDTIKRIFDRLKTTEVISDEQSNHIQELFKRKTLS